MILSFIAVLGIGSIVAALITWRTAISNYRQAWINDLRDDISTYLKELEAMHYAIGNLFSAETDETLEKQKQEARIAIFSFTGGSYCDLIEPKKCTSNCGRDLMILW